MKIKAENTQSIVCPNCGMSNNAKELNKCMYCSHSFVAYTEKELTETEKEEIAETAEPCDTEDCEEDACSNCNKTSCDGCDHVEQENPPAEKKPEKELADPGHDEEFMDSISEEPKKKMTPEQSKKRREYLETRNKEILGNLERNEQVAELAGHYGLQILIADLETGACSDVKKHEIKEATKSIKSLEAVLTFKSLVSARRVLISDLKRELSANEGELQRLDAPQLTLFENIPQEEQQTEIVEGEAVEAATDDQDLIDQIPQEKEAAEVA